MAFPTIYSQTPNPSEATIWGFSAVDLVIEDEARSSCGAGERRDLSGESCREPAFDLPLGHGSLPNFRSGWHECTSRG